MCTVVCTVDTYLTRRSHPTIQYTVYSIQVQYSYIQGYNGDDGSDDDRYDRMIYDTMICYEREDG